MDGAESRTKTFYFACPECGKALRCVGYVATEGAQTIPVPGHLTPDSGRCVRAGFDYDLPRPIVGSFFPLTDEVTTGSFDGEVEFSWSPFDRFTRRVSDYFRGCPLSTLVALASRIAKVTDTAREIQDMFFEPEGDGENPYRLTRDSVEVFELARECLEERLRRGLATAELSREGGWSLKFTDSVGGETVTLPLEAVSYSCSTEIKYPPGKADGLWGYYPGPGVVDRPASDGDEE